MKAGVLELVITYAEAHNIQLVCLQEARWPGFVDIVVLGWRFIGFNRGSDDPRQNAGVAVLISPDLQASFQGYALDNPRHMRVYIRTIDGTSIIDNIHCPDETAAVERKR